MDSAVIFWLLALLPGLLHPFLLFIYFRRFDERKRLIALLLDRSVKSGPPAAMPERWKQHEEWQSRLDLNGTAYVLPVVITSLLSVVGAVVIFDRYFAGHNYFGLPAAVFDFTVKIPTLAAIAGFVGAYVWGLYDFVDRFRILSLPPSALHMIWFRIVLGAVLGAFSEQIIVKDFAPFFAFALASIPVPSLLKWVQDTASQRFAIGGQTPVVPPQWELVQGLTPDIISRLNEAGVSSVAHLGNQDPVRLMRSTNIEWRNVLDMMDQAYLASYVGKDIEKLRAKGIRGSIEMGTVYQRFRDPDPRRSSNAAEVMKSLAADLGIDEASVQNLARNLWADPQVDRIWSLWFDRDGQAGAEDESGNRQQITDEPGGEPVKKTAAGQS